MDILSIFKFPDYSRSSERISNYLLRIPPNDTGVTEVSTSRPFCEVEQSEDESYVDLRATSSSRW